MLVESWRRPTHKRCEMCRGIVENVADIVPRDVYADVCRPLSRRRLQRLPDHASGQQRRSQLGVVVEQVSANQVIDELSRKISSRTPPRQSSPEDLRRTTTSHTAEKKLTIWPMTVGPALHPVRFRPG